MAISGTRISNPNFQLRFFAICFMGIAAFASVLWWRQQVLVNAEYVDIPGHAKRGRDISQDIIAPDYEYQAKHQTSQTSK